VYKRDGREGSMQYFIIPPILLFLDFLILFLSDSLPLWFHCPACKSLSIFLEVTVDIDSV
jgi:hypothetical protein